jgi:hypothetical protein
MAGTHYSRKSSDAPRTVRRPRTASAWSVDGTRTAGPDRLSLRSLRSSDTSRCVGVSGMARLTETPDPCWSGLRRGGAGYWQSVARFSTITSASPGRSVAMRSVGFSDGVLNALQRGDDPSDRTEESPRTAQPSRGVVDARSDEARHVNHRRGDHDNHSGFVGVHSGQSNRVARPEVRRG